MSKTDSHSLVLEAARTAIGWRDDSIVEGPILVALSGGADSVAVVLAFLEVGAAIGVAHLDHRTREGKSTEDAQWVKAFCAARKIPCFVETIDVPALAQASTQSFEEVARTVRYDFLVETARAQGYTAIATGHHADDQAETVLMRVVRGTSIKGLGGIPRVGSWGGMPLLRPLLGLRRSSIERYVRDHTVDYREDHTNADPQYVRNRVRHTLMPLLRESFNPQVEDALGRLAQLAQDEDAVMQALSDEAYAACVQGDEIDRAAFENLPRAIQRRVVLGLAHEVEALAEFEATEGALDFIVDGATGQHYDWGRGVHLSNGRETTLIVPPAATTRPISVECSVPGTVEAFGHRWTFSVLETWPDVSLAEYCSPTRQVVDARALGEQVTLRHRKDGDRFQPMGMQGTRKVKDYLNDCGLPLEQRDALVLVLSDDALVWIAGHAIAQPFAVTKETESLVQIEVVAV